MQSLGLFCSQDILVAAYPLIFSFIVDINKYNFLLSSTGQRASAYW